MKSNTIKLIESMQSNLNESTKSKEEIIALMKSIGIISAGISDEHKQYGDNYYGYGHITTQTQEEFYISYQIIFSNGGNIIGAEIISNGRPWEFLMNDKPNNEEIVKYITDNEKTLNEIFTYLVKNQGELKITNNSIEESTENDLSSLIDDAYNGYMEEDPNISDDEKYEMRSVYLYDTFEPETNSQDEAEKCYNLLLQKFKDNGYDIYTDNYPWNGQIRTVPDNIAVAIKSIG